MNSWRPAVATGIITALVVLVLVSVPTTTRRASTCLLCRALRVDHTFVGLPWSEQLETDCSRWYTSHLRESNHTHLWKRSSCQAYTTGFGLGRGFMCGRSHPIWNLPDSLQLEIYRHFPNPADARALFRSLDGTGSAVDPEATGSQEALTVEALSRWALAGFPKPWEKWCMPFLKKGCKTQTDSR
jgi:hypothetical protein